MKYQSPEWLTDCVTNQRKIPVVVIGAGGTGSEVLSKLFRLDHLLKQLGGAGLSITVYDDDVVTAANVGRQAFYSFDLGRPKSEVLVSRFAQYSDMDIQAVTERFTPEDIRRHLSYKVGAVLMTCVDNPQTRIELGNALRTDHADSNILWIDGGNDRSSGQVVLGSYESNQGNTKPLRLPSVYDLFEEQLKESVKTFTDTDSCSHEEAIAKQDFGVNDAVAVQMVQLLWRLTRYGELAHHGAHIDLESAEVTPMEIDPLSWQMYGYAA